MADQDRLYEQVWTQFIADEYPQVVIATVRVYHNPLVVRANELSPLIVMARGLWSFACTSILAALSFAEEPQELQPSPALGVLRRSLEAWAAMDPRLGPGERDVQRLATLNAENTTYAVGLATAAFTWAFYHEVGHLKLGHLAGNGAGAGTPSYAHDEEYAADRFGFERFLGLMPFESEIRRLIEFGAQADHGPILLFDLMDLAYRLHPEHDRRDSPTHPAPLARKARLLEQFESQLSSGGRELYDYWRELLTAIEGALTA